jgi:hypothetical protein
MGRGSLLYLFFEGVASPRFFRSGGKDAFYMQKPKINRDGTITVRIRATGQVLDLVPFAAYPMLHGGTAEAVDTVPQNNAQTECTAVAPAGERAVAAAQSGPKRKTAARR